MGRPGRLQGKGLRGCLPIFAAEAAFGTNDMTEKGLTWMFSNIFRPLVHFPIFPEGKEVGVEGFWSVIRR